MQSWPSSVPCRHVPGEAEENDENLIVAGRPAEIWTEHIQNTSIEHYRYSIPFCT
jgi:hypothetical protein